MPIFQCIRKNHGIDSSLENLSTEEENEENPEKYASSRAYANAILENHPVAMFQNGVLRTNCIDCLDRTNVAQYAYGLVALGRQLHSFGFTNSPKMDLDNPLAEELMQAYESMGDTLALQYGGSAAHNKVLIYGSYRLLQIFNKNEESLVTHAILVLCTSLQRSQDSINE